mmetsp:Transcript_25516/g.37665  ORF Transcript_25516/g.37665 Transcript_25516/m.37665 type:complete len:392 (+) Transcript_25516:71-1246(+)
MGCGSSHGSILWYDGGRVCIKNAHKTVPDKPAENLLSFDLDSYADFHSVFGKPWWVTFEVAERMGKIYSIDIASFNAECSPKLIEVKYSNDNKNWQLVTKFHIRRPWGTGCASNEELGAQTHDSIQSWSLPAPIHARYVRIDVMKTHNGKGPSLHYIRLINTPSTDTCEGTLAGKQCAPRILSHRAIRNGWTEVEAVVKCSKEPGGPYSIESVLDYSYSNYVTFQGGTSEPWWIVFELKHKASLELCGVEIASYIDSDSPRVIQVEVSRDMRYWEEVKTIKTSEPWGTGHRQSNRPRGHPLTKEPNVVRGKGENTQLWALQSAASIRFPQFVMLSIPRTYSGGPPSLHYVRFFKTHILSRSTTDMSCGESDICDMFSVGDHTTSTCSTKPR